MLVIECKGYGVRRSHTGAWTRVIDGAEQPLRENPFEQAQRHSKELRKILEPRLKKAFPGLDHFPFACGQAVAFPLSLAGDVNLPLDVPWAVVYDAKDLGNIRECVMESFRVRGGAGTGKTVLAMEAAVRFAREGGRVLLVCFNRSLGGYLKIIIDARDTGTGSVTADSFHRLCARANFLLNSRNLAVPEDEEQKAAFWDSEAPMLLLQAVEEKKLGPFDAVIVDEGQDFASSWWDVLEEMLAEDGRMLVFYDPSQRIFKKGDSAPPAVGV